MNTDYPDINRQRFTKNQGGLTLVEMLVALAIGSIIVVGALLLFQHMVTVADENKEKSYASLQVQYVGFWINEDATQAQTINIGNSTEDDDGFPLIITSVRGDLSGSEYIQYDLVTMEGESELRKLIRTTRVYQGSMLDQTQSGSHVVAEYIDPDGTHACRRQYGNATTPESPAFYMKSIRITVSVNVDGNRAVSDYEIYPRSTVSWFPQETVDPDHLGEYRGPACPS